MARLRSKSLAHSTTYDARSTADQVIAGIDLSGKHFVVTGCNSGIGFETMNSLAANGAHVFGLARSIEDAQAACRRAGPTCIPIGCDLADPGAVAAAVTAIRAFDVTLDGIVANAGVARLPNLQTSHGIEMHFMVNCVGHFALINGLGDALREGAGRVVINSGDGVGFQRGGIDFDNLDGASAYDPVRFYGQSKLAVALLAKELSRRWASRGIAVNSVDPGATRGTGIDRHVAGSVFRAIRRMFMRSAQRGAATQTLLAAHPTVGGITGQHWRDCRTVAEYSLEGDPELTTRLWEVCERLAASGVAPTHGAAAPSLEAAPSREAAPAPEEAGPHIHPDPRGSMQVAA